jgi:hypothetical protein
LKNQEPKTKNKKPKPTNINITIGPMNLRANPPNTTPAAIMRISSNEISFLFQPTIFLADDRASRQTFFCKEISQLRRITPLDIAKLELEWLKVKSTC